VTEPSFNRAEVEGAIAAAFSPHSPVNQANLFKGRVDQIRTALDAAQTTGLHAAIYGERGVGKTSLANMIRDSLEKAETGRVNCSEADTFTTVMRRLLASITRSSREHSEPGFAERSTTTRTTVGEDLPKGELSPDYVASQIAELPQRVVLIVDEFDRLKAAETHSFADFLKSLSDRGSRLTVVIVGVAEDVTALIREHASVERCLRQIHLPRMSDGELTEIVQGGLAAAGLAPADEAALAYVLHVSQGFPHYTHLLAQNAARVAVEQERLAISPDDVIEGMRRAVDQADQSHRELYHKAVTGTTKENLWKDVATACAIAPCDERGYFSSRDAQEKLSGLRGQAISPPTLAYHLGKMTEEGRGPLLERLGQQRRYRYRFVKPFMRPFIVMKAINEGHLRIERGPRPSASDS
jgi:Cdc6-like AAA superfamily ATPase